MVYIYIYFILCMYVALIVAVLLIQGAFETSLPCLCSCMGCLFLQQKWTNRDSFQNLEQTYITKANCGSVVDLWRAYDDLYLRVIYLSQGRTVWFVCPMALSSSSSVAVVDSRPASASWPASKHVHRWTSSTLPDMSCVNSVGQPIGHVPRNSAAPLLVVLRVLLHPEEDIQLWFCGTLFLEQRGIHTITILHVIWRIILHHHILIITY